MKLNYVIEKKKKNCGEFEVHYKEPSSFGSIKSGTCFHLGWDEIVFPTSKVIYNEI
jgi:hypothetical protein